MMNEDNPVLDYLEEHGVESCVFQPFVLGKNYYFRCGIYSTVGRVAAYSLGAGFIKLEDASFVRDDSSYSETIRSGFPSGASLEYIGEQFVAISFIGDFVEYRHKLPT